MLTSTLSGNFSNLLLDMVPCSVATNLHMGASRQTWKARQVLLPRYIPVVSFPFPYYQKHKDEPRDLLFRIFYPCGGTPAPDVLETFLYQLCRICSFCLEMQNFHMGLTTLNSEHMTVMVYLQGKIGETGAAGPRGFPVSSTSEWPHNPH